MTQIDDSYIEEFINLRNRITEQLEKRRFTRWPTSMISRLLHPNWFGLQILDGGQVIKEGTMYTQGNYYAKYVDGIEPFVRLIVKLDKKSLDRALLQAEDLVAHPRKMWIMGKGGGIGINRPGR